MPEEKIALQCPKCGVEIDPMLGIVHHMIKIHDCTTNLILEILFRLYLELEEKIAKLPEK